MSVTIEVYRGSGDREGDEINEPLLGSSLAAALSRGQAALDANAQQLQTTTLDLTSPRFDLRLGNLIAVASASQGREMRGKIVGISHSPKGGEAPTTLTVEYSVDE